MKILELIVEKTTSISEAPTGQGFLAGLKTGLEKGVSSLWSNDSSTTSNSKISSPSKNSLSPQSKLHIDKIKASIMPNITGTSVGVVSVKIETEPDGTIVSSQLIKSSGNSDWDNAVLQGIDKTQKLPTDNLGRMPPSIKINIGESIQQGVGTITEYRDRLLQYVKSLLPNYPEYVLKDWLVPNKGDFSNLPDTELKNDIMEKLKGAGLTPNTKWQLVPDMKFTMDMFEPMTKQRLIGRAGGSSDLGMGIPRDKERHATQAALAQQQGGVRKEPVLLIKTDKGYELLEGWHRTIQHFAKYPNGYTGPAYVATAQSQTENKNHTGSMVLEGFSLFRKK